MKRKGEKTKQNKRNKNKMVKKSDEKKTLKTGMRKPSTLY